MKNLLTILCAATLVIAAMAPASAQGTGNDGIGIFVNTGFGWANNLRLADWLNGQEIAGKGAVGTNPEVKSDKSNIIYGGFDLEPRYFTGNIVYGLSIGYHNTTKGEREVQGGLGVYTATADLSFFSMRASAYYRVGLSDSSFILLGGGLGYYRASLSLNVEANGVVLAEGDGTGWTIGWHAGLEYNKKLGPVFVSLGIMSRFAEVWNMEVDNQNGSELYDASANLTGIYFYVGAGYMI